ncbi:MAG: DNA mismatch repair endonuclease MutL, partial [Planctomycetota bacterium]|nr:DNA mismatch repair endonuclease MutL [Planctomycetota bacterium]
MDLTELPSEPKPRSTIMKLPAGVVNKIAAGEVIERPASVVKELMENSIDAGSTRIDVLIEKGGVDLIRIADNGCGIPRDELTLAIESHATSKIRDADDLFDVETMGFRGEALASISEVSQFLLRSLSEKSDSGFEITVNGGHVGDIVPCGSPQGTVIEVRNLFFNTPVRRKFLKTTQTEVGHVSEAFTRIALAFPQLHFTLTHNTRSIHDLPPTNEITSRILAFFGPEIHDSLIPISSEHDGIRISGFAVDPSHSRSHTRMQYLFLNGRHIRDKSLQHALREAYRGLLLHGRYPIAFLNLEMPADQIDVNVHPAKLEVRFQEGGRLYSQLLGTLRNHFLTTDLKSRIDRPNQGVST